MKRNVQTCLNNTTFIRYKCNYYNYSYEKKVFRLFSLGHNYLHTLNFIYLPLQSKTSCLTSVKLSKTLNILIKTLSCHIQKKLLIPFLMLTLKYKFQTCISNSLQNRLCCQRLNNVSSKGINIHVGYTLIKIFIARNKHLLRFIYINHRYDWWNT